MDRDKAIEAYDKVQENSRRMVRLLTLIATETDPRKYYEEMLSAKENIAGLIISMAITINGLLEWAAYNENNTLLDQIQNLALEHERFTVEDALTEYERLEDGR